MSLSQSSFCFFFFNDTATTEIYTLSLHDALPISADGLEDGGAGELHADVRDVAVADGGDLRGGERHAGPLQDGLDVLGRSEEHTSELQSRQYLVCRLLLEKKKKKQQVHCDIGRVY